MMSLGEIEILAILKRRKKTPTSGLHSGRGGGDKLDIPQRPRVGPELILTFPLTHPKGSGGSSKEFATTNSPKGP